MQELGRGLLLVMTETDSRHGTCKYLSYTVSVICSYLIISVDLIELLSCSF